MITKIMSANDSAIPVILQVLNEGGLVAFPTDTVYGLGCSIINSAAIERIYQVKERSHLKSIAALIGSPEQIHLLVSQLPPAADKLIRRFFPGALTLVVPRRTDLPSNLSASLTIGVRMPDHPFATTLLQRTGPLAVTSANISGEANPITAQDVLAQLDGRIELVVDGGACPGGIPSTVVDCTQPNVSILRPGGISREAILSCLAESDDI